MTVVTDTSVILDLCLIQQEAYCLFCLGRSARPLRSSPEFQRLASVDPRFQNLTIPDFIQPRAPQRILSSLTTSQRLQAGEIAALSLAVELKADAVLMDERAGRTAAIALGLRPVGLLGILLDAKDRALIPALTPLITRLEHEAEFWIGESLRSSVLKDAGEEP